MHSKTDSLSGSAEPPAVETAAPHHTIWDRVGIAGSLLCVAHCAITPLVIGYLSVMGLEFLGDEIIHQILAICLLGIALLAFIPGFRHHKNRLILVAGGLGITLLVTASFFVEHLLSHGAELGLTIAGSLLLVGAHAANWRLASRHSQCCEPTDTTHH